MTSIPFSQRNQRPAKRRLTIALLFGLALVALPITPWADIQTDLINQAKERLQDDRVVEALALAKDAVRTNANDYRGHYYVALANLGLGRFDEADQAAQRARALAPDTAQAAVDKLIASIRSRRQGVGSAQAADAAFADGLAGKAARLYEAAWNNGRDNPDMALKAAELYANQLDQPIDAGRLLRQVIQAGRSSAAAERAGTELGKLAATLRKIAEGHVEAARRQTGEAARRSLQLAEDADPGYLPLHQARARLAAQGDDSRALQAAIRELARHKAAGVKDLARLPNMRKWLERAEFAEYMVDLLGDGQALALRQLADAEARAAAEAAEVARAAARAAETLVRAIERDMVIIPAGRFEMGSNDGLSDEKPVHTVLIKQFALSKHEVTQGQWRAVMGSNPSHFKDCGDDCPVEYVSWDDAQDFVLKLSQLAGNTYRLPSEAEWEYACRAGGDDSYCGGNDLGTLAWVDGNSGSRTHRVGQKQANPFGLYDMTGNVWEWTQDCWNDSYRGAPADGSAWARGECGRRVERGGSWSNIPYLARAANRSRDPTGDRNLNVGFRGARTLF